MSDSRALGGVPDGDNLPEVSKRPALHERHDRTKAAPTPTRSVAIQEEEKKPGIFKRIWIFFTQVIDELRKVIYPTKKETWTYFVVVIVFVAVVMLFTGIVDEIFARIAALIFG